MVSGSISLSWLRLLRFLRASVACQKGFTVVSYVSFAVRTGSYRVVSGGHLQGNSGGVSDDARARLCDFDGASCVGFTCFLRVVCLSV